MKNIYKYSILIIFVVIIAAGFFILRCASADKNIYIVYTTDRNYIPYTKTAVKSAAVNKKPSSRYRISILCVDLTPEERESFKTLETKNVSIKTIPLSIESVQNIAHNPVRKIHISKADLFKFYMAEIFPHIDKILYLDSDTIVRKDLSELFNTDIKDYYLAAAKRPGDEYNCGVLLYNLKKWREDNIKDKLIEAKKYEYGHSCMSQCVFNKVLPYEHPYDKVKTFSTIYNVIIYWFGDNKWKRTSGFYDFEKFKSACSPYLDSMNSFGDLEKNAAIIHHAAGRKPWCRMYKDFEKFTNEWIYYSKMVNPDWNYQNCSYSEPGIYGD